MGKIKFNIDKDEAIRRARRMLEIKREWCECVRNGIPVSTLEAKGVEFYKFEKEIYESIGREDNKCSLSL